MVNLSYGGSVGNYSEKYWLHGEALWVLKRYRTKKTRLAYLDAVEEKRGRAARVALREEMMRIWRYREEKKA